jgi:hypothetical protein
MVAIGLLLQMIGRYDRPTCDRSNERKLKTKRQRDTNRRAPGRFKRYRHYHLLVVLDVDVSKT